MNENVCSCWAGAHRRSAEQGHERPAAAGVQPVPGRLSLYHPELGSVDHWIRCLLCATENYGGDLFCYCAVVAVFDIWKHCWGVFIKQWTAITVNSHVLLVPLTPCVFVFFCACVGPQAYCLWLYPEKAVQELLPQRLRMHPPRPPTFQMLLERC